MKRNLLIHSLSELKSIYLPILDLVKPRTIGEIGVEFAGNTEILLSKLNEYEAHLYSIEPYPTTSVKELFDKIEKATLLVDKSLDVIKKLPEIDVWFIDGDHNWYTVFNELVEIDKINKENNESIIFLHDVGFPWARRDLYYNPEAIPKEHLHEYSWDHGVTYDDEALLNKGFRGCGSFAIALESNTPQNGVLTAIEDFINTVPKCYTYINIPAVFGLGVLIKNTHSKYRDIIEYLTPYNNNELLYTLEDNRLSNYLRVIEMQDSK